MQTRQPNGLVEEFRQTMAQLAAGVCVVTTVDDDGLPWGFTASSVTSVSLRPPMLLCCIARTARAHRVFTASDRLAVSILGDEQRSLARSFSTPVADRFLGAGFQAAPSGMPVHPDALGWFDCRLDRTVEAGDHTVLLATVTTAQPAAGRPLVYFDRAYRDLLPG